MPKALAWGWIVTLPEVMAFLKLAKSANDQEQEQQQPQPWTGASRRTAGAE